MIDGSNNLCSFLILWIKNLKYLKKQTSSINKNDLFNSQLKKSFLSHLCRVIDTRNQGNDFSGGSIVKDAHDAAGINVWKRGFK